MVKMRMNDDSFRLCREKESFCFIILVFINILDIFLMQVAFD